MAKSLFAGLLLLAAGCATAESPVDVVPRSGSGATNGLDARFAELHEKYLEADQDYIPLLRATLRHARRLVPTECLAAQTELVSYGASDGYDGLEPLWLIYQDCVASGSPLAVGLGRAANFADFQQTLGWVEPDPHPQLFPRVSHYNARIDRGVRGDALRALLTSHASQGVSGSWISLHTLLRSPTVIANLCALPLRLNQLGAIAEAELLRHATCVAGVGSNIVDACGQLFPGGQSGGASVPGLSAADSARLEGMCDRMGNPSGGSMAGIDMLDGFSTDWCLGEAAGRVSAEEVPGLIMDCYFGNEAGPSPVADGGVTSANFQEWQYAIVTWDAGGYHEATLLMEPQDGGSRYALGDTPEAAEAALRDDLLANPPPGYEATENEDGTITLTTEYTFTKDDGTQGTGTKKHTVAEGGAVVTTWNFSDNSGDHERTVHNGNNGSGFARLVTLVDGKKKKEVLVEWSNGTTTTTTTEYDDEENVVSVSKETTTPGTPDGFDPNNPACQELMALGLAFGSRDEMFDALYERGMGPGPEVIYPTPDDDSTWGEAPSCGAAGLGGNAGQPQCSSPVMCEEGSVLNEDCMCEQEVGTVPARGCIEITCANGTYPVPVGGFGCTCESEEEAPGSLPPTPDPTMLREMTEEFVWNRPEGEIIVTPEMEDDFYNGGPPPF